MTQNKHYYFLNLGCPKNQVDGDNLRGALNNQGLIETDAPDEVDYIIINTCAFIEEARLESQGEIKELEKFRQRGTNLIAVGCYPALETIRNDIPVLDAAFRFDEVEALLKYVTGDKAHCYDSGAVNRVVGEVPYAYLVISDGCDNRCSYCKIPGIRGSYRSRPIVNIMREAEYLAKNGIKELILVAQDTAVYGQDIPGKPDLACLCRMLAGIEAVKWLRIMYAHPAHLNEDLIDKLMAIDEVCHYLDMPIQHISNKILSRMKRQCGPEKIKSVINHLRKIDNNISLRTTLMVGFPGETDDDFRELLDLVEEIEFDYLGVFKYSPEIGTPAYGFVNRVDREITEERFDLLYEIAEDISLKRAEAQIGRTEKLLVERLSPDAYNFYEGRSFRQAPEIDGYYMIEAGSGIKSGDFVETIIKDIDLAEVKYSKMKVSE